MAIGMPFTIAQQNCANTDTVDRSLERKLGKLIREQAAAIRPRLVTEAPLAAEGTPTHCEDCCSSLPLAGALWVHCVHCSKLVPESDHAAAPLSAEDAACWPNAANGRRTATPPLQAGAPAPLCSSCAALLIADWCSTYQAIAEIAIGLAYMVRDRDSEDTVNIPQLWELLDYLWPELKPRFPTSEDA